MKLKGLMTLCIAGASALGVYAQTHVEGQEYYRADQLENAKELLTRALSNSGTDKAVANYYLGMIAADEKDNAAAAKYFEAGVQAKPEGCRGLVQGGTEAFEEGSPSGDSHSPCIRGL